MTIEIATESDIDDLALVEIESKRHSIPAIIEDVEVDKALRVNRWLTYFKGQSPATSKPDRLVLKAVSAKNIVGYIAGHLTSRYNMDAEIQSFYILKEYQRQGLGRKLLAEFARWLESKNVTSLCVGIAPTNVYKAFYIKNGGRYLNDHWIFWDNIKQLTMNKVC